jgi:hypothetical protein
MFPSRANLRDHRELAYGACRALSQGEFHGLSPMHR